MGVPVLAQCWQTCAVLRWQLEARRNTLMMSFTTLNNPGLSPESQPKCLCWSVSCAHEVLETSQRHLVRSAKGPAASLQLVPVRAGSSWKCYRMPVYTFNHLKDFKLMVCRCRFSAEIRQVEIPCISIRPWTCLPLLLAVRKSSVPKGADGEGNVTYLQLLKGKFKAVKGRCCRR